MFYSLLQEQYPDLLSVLEAQHADQSPITILAPSNDAFEKIPDSSIGDAFKANQTDAVRSVLEYHVLPGYHQTQTFSTSFQFLPTWLSDAESTNVTSGQRVGVVSQPPYYVFVSAMGTRSTIISPDIAFTGGVLHMIDMPVIPPMSYPETAESFNTTAFLGLNYQNQTLAEYMNTTSDITIFAPANSAFQSISTSPVFFQTNATAVLTQLSEYHIVKFPFGPVYSSMLMNGTSLTTLQGSTITVRFEDNSFFLNSARIIQSDLLIANGVMHVIDNVLDYNASSAEPNPTLGTQAPVLPQGTASGDGPLPFTTAIPNTSAVTSTTSMTGSAAASGASGASTTIEGAAASTTYDSGHPSTTKKSAASGSLKGGSETTKALAYTLLVWVFCLSAWL